MKVLRCGHLRSRQPLRASSRTEEVLHSGCLVEDLPRKSELTLPTVVQCRYVHGFVLRKGHLRCQNGRLRDSARGEELSELKVKREKLEV